jgi:ligand-binding sensor protein
LIEKKLGFKLNNCGVEALVEALPKVLVEDLEIVKDVEIEIKGDYVRFKFYDSIYADFCYEVRESSRRCALGCPMCSALASMLAVATGKPALYEEDKMSDDRKIVESIYHLISGPRL